MHGLHQRAEHVDGGVGDTVVIPLQRLGHLPSHLLPEASEGGEAAVARLACHQAPEGVELLLELPSGNVVLVALLSDQAQDGRADQLLLVLSEQVLLDKLKILSFHKQSFECLSHLRGGVKESTVADIRIKECHSSGKVPAHWLSSQELQTRTLYFLQAGKVQGCQSLAPLQVVHPHMDIRVTRSSGAVQERCQEAVPVSGEIVPTLAICPLDGQLLGVLLHSDQGSHLNNIVQTLC